MNINWVLSDRIAIDPTVNFEQLHNTGSFWGSWRTWRTCQTDNVICHSLSDAHNLIQRKFHQQCNFYIPDANYQNLERPPGVKLYQGDFVHDVDHQEEIVAMHLAASVCDIVLLLGFDFSESVTNPDRLLEHRAHHYRNLVNQAIKNNPKVQWIAVNHQGKLTPDLVGVEQFSTDTVENILDLLNS
jgi:hypothetical protein